MSEVDRVSNSGLYPALPLGDRRRKEGSEQPPQRDSTSGDQARAGPSSPVKGPRPPKSLIDEYA